jgi:hypothetical protein
MTAKKPNRSKQTSGGRVTPKGTKPAGEATHHTAKPTGFGSPREPGAPVDPLRNRQLNAPRAPSRAAHRGQR